MVNEFAGGAGISRRGFIQNSIGATAMFLAASQDTAAVDAAAAKMTAAAVLVQSLDGADWKVQQDGRNDETFQANVPGDIFTDLIAAKRLPDPYFRDNNAKVQWVGKRAWRYTRQFTPEAKLLAQKFVRLRCHGLDTLATVWINGVRAGQADNMYRKWEFDIKKLLRSGENSLEIVFEPTAPYAAGRVAKYRNNGLIKLLKNPQTWVRKAPYMWGWDWCRPLLTCGIWKPIELIGFDCRIADLRVEQNLQPSKPAILNVVLTTDGPSVAPRAYVSVLYNNRKIASETMTISEGHGSAELHIPEPQLWWPNGMGPQNLYSVQVELMSAGGTVIDQAQRRIGLRTIRHIARSGNTAVHLEVNGVPFFAKGADWIPADNIPTRVTPEILRRYMEDARDCNFNMLRFWGGGYYEPQSQFDACDELGILVLFEFKFANHCYPVFDEHWMNNVRQEVQEQVRLNRHHPCIALWSGNNEIYWFPGFNRLFKTMIGEILHRELPNANYETGSGDPGNKEDIHYWGPWNVTDPPKKFRNANGFITEFGMQSFPDPRTVDAYTVQADRNSIYSQIMVYHERSFGRSGIDGMLRDVDEYFGATPKDFVAALWLTQIAQAYVIAYGVEHWRRNMPQTMATLIWQMNDSWPGPTWSLIDWYHRWKAIMYASKRFFAPVLVSTRTDEKTGDVEIWVTSDHMKSMEGELAWRATDMDGRVLHYGSKKIDIPARTSHAREKWNYSNLSGNPGKDNVLIWSSVSVSGKIVSEGCHFFVPPKKLKLRDPGLSSRVMALGNNVFRVVVQAHRPALWVWAHLKDADARYSDNFIHINAGQTLNIEVRPEISLSLPEFQNQLEIRNLRDVSPGKG